MQRGSSYGFETVGSEQSFFSLDVEDKNKLVKQNLFPFLWGILKHLKKRSDPVLTRYLVDSSELRDYHLTAMSEMCGRTCQQLII